MVRTLTLILLISLGSLYGEKSSQLQKLANRLYENSKMGPDLLGYSQYILKHIETNHNILPDDYQVKRYHYGRHQPQALDTFSLFSGGLAIRESMQYHTIKHSTETGGTVSVDSLQGPVIESHPYKKMLLGKQFNYFDLAALAPNDFYYLHFSNMGRALNFFDYLLSVGGSLYQRFSPRAVHFGLKEKLLTQLALQENKKARQFYDRVFSEMMVVGTDPFFLQGTDISLVYRLKKPAIFKVTMSLYRSGYKQSHGATEKSIKIGKYNARLLSTKDRRVHSVYMLLNDETAIISNSVKAVEAILKAQSNPAYSMAESADFQYMRHIYPANNAEEDAFFFFSDAFIRHLVSPRLRIKESRRMFEAMRISNLEKYLVYFFQLNGQKARTMAELKKTILSTSLSKKDQALINELRRDPVYRLNKGRLNRYFYSWFSLESILAQGLAENADFKNTPLAGRRSQARIFTKRLKQVYKTVRDRKPENANQAIEFLRGQNLKALEESLAGLNFYPGSFRAYSEKYGASSYLKPLIETDIQKVSEQEAKQYKDFVTSYSNFWREYFDPIGIRINMKDGIKVETTILPLINNSIYNRVTEYIGGTPVFLAPSQGLKDEIFSTAIKLKKDFVEGLDKDMPPVTGTENIPLSKIIGDQVSLHILDSEPLVDFDGRLLADEILRRRPKVESLFAGLLGWSLFHPVRVSIPLKDSNAAETYLAYLDRSYSRGVFKSRWFETDQYTYSSNSIKVRTLKLTILGTLTFRLFYAVIDDNLHITTTEDYMNQLINSRLSFQEPGRQQANIALIYRPEKIIKERRMFERGLVEAAMQASFSNHSTYDLLHQLFGDADVEQAALSNFGFYPLCPAGGTYNLNKEGQVENSTFGTYYRRHIQYEKLNYPAIERFFSTRQIKVLLKFTNEGIMTEIETR